MTRRKPFPCPAAGSPMGAGSLVLKAPAKINWFLQILGRRADGYHNISSLMQCVSLYDEIVLSHADSVEVEANMKIPIHENIVHKAASLLRDRTSYRKGVKIILKKNIPAGAGLGGGSSDAAFVLCGLNELWGLGLSGRELIAIGAELGSDIPFFFRGPAAFVGGRGEKIKPVGISSSSTLLLVKPRVSVPTAWAYSRFDSRREEKLTKKPVDIKLFCQALGGLKFVVLRDLLCNDFEEVVMSEYPVVRQIKQRLLKNGALIAAMSGSGSAVFGVFGDAARAEIAARAMEPDFFCRVVETLV